MWTFAGQEYTFTVPPDAPAYVAACLQNDVQALQSLVESGEVDPAGAEVTVLFKEMDEEFEVPPHTCTRARAAP